MRIVAVVVLVQCVWFGAQAQASSFGKSAFGDSARSSSFDKERGKAAPAKDAAVVAQPQPQAAPVVAAPVKLPAGVAAAPVAAMGTTAASSNSSAAGRPVSAAKAPLGARSNAALAQARDYTKKGMTPEQQAYYRKLLDKQLAGLGGQKSSSSFSGRAGAGGAVAPYTRAVESSD